MLAKKRIVRILAMFAAALGLLALVLGIRYRPAFGVRAGARDLAPLAKSSQWDAEEEVFVNPQKLWNDMSIGANLRAYQEQGEFTAPRDPKADLAQQELSTADLEKVPASGLRVTWFGHSSLYLQIDGSSFLIDPVWGASSPIPWAGPGRWIQPSIELKELPVPAAVVISHDHYDHLDYLSILAIKDWDTQFVVPLGVRQHLIYWGVDPSKVVALDWWQRHKIGDLELVCTPARHASGRGIFDQNATLWAGWAFVGPEHRVFYSGDTGLFDGLKTIGEKLGPFDLSMIEVGQYHPNWPDWHLGPEQAVLAHQWVNARKMLPVHWGAYTLAMHSWTAPVERTYLAAKAAGVELLTPRLCEPVEPATAGYSPWWPQGIPFLSAQEQPVVANDANGRPPKVDP